MYCINCGKELPENSKFCNHCGALQDKTAFTQPLEQPKIKKKSNAKSIVFWMIFGLISWAVIIYAISNSDSLSGSVATVEKDVSAFMNVSDLTEDEVETILEKLNETGVDNIEDVEVINSESDTDNETVFEITYSGYIITLFVTDGKAEKIVSGEVVLYENGEVVDNMKDHIITSTEKKEFIEKTKQFVLQGLISPSTAQFPDAVFESEEWTVSRNKDLITVKSYVDSQNSFGAMIRNKFTAQISYYDGSLIYMSIGDTKVYGEPQTR